MSDVSRHGRDWPVVLAVGGLDPTGAAGLAADVRAGEAVAAHVAPVAAALTAQNSAAVRQVLAVSPSMLRAQIEAVFEEFPVTAVKTGLLPSGGLIGIIAEILPQGLPLVIDPVLTASSGGALAASDGGGWLAALGRLAARAALVTPNAPEAAALLGVPPATGEDDLSRQAAALRARLRCPVLLKGGHVETEGEVIDVLAAAGGTRVFRNRRVAAERRGTGCSLATMIAAGLARGRGLEEALEEARTALLAGLGEDVGPRGRGAPPVRPRGRERPSMNESDNQEYRQ